MDTFLDFYLNNEIEFEGYEYFVFSSSYKLV